MREIRLLGNYVQSLAQSKHISEDELSHLLDCSPKQVYAFFKGRSFVSFAQLSKIAACFDTTIDNLLDGNSEIYDSTVVHCINTFQNSENREIILDIIDGYIDIVDALSI